jgi:hypothetical protein
MLFPKWRKVEESGELSAFLEGLRNTKPHIPYPQTLYPKPYIRIWGYYILGLKVCQGFKYPAKKLEK